MSIGMRKAEKRELEKSNNFFALFKRVQDHFLPDLFKWFENMKDPRNTAYIKYAQSILIGMILMKCICGIESMRKMNHVFNSDAAIQNLTTFIKIDKVKEMPDWQTANNYLERLDPKELERIRTMIIKALIRTKQFYNYTTGGYYRIILDGTGLASFDESHSEHDLKRVSKKGTPNEKVLYMNHVLEAKIVLAPGLVLSIDTEFIENESSEYKKQDCENRAAKRLLERLHRLYPKMKFIIQGDGLYSVEPIMQKVKEYGWKYIFTIKEGMQPTVLKEFSNLLPLNDHIELEVTCPKDKGIAQAINHIEISAGKEQIFNVFQYTYEETHEEGKKEKKTFIWVTNIEITAKNLPTLVSCARGRWKIEESFCNQKTGLLEMEHLWSLDYNAMKAHYLLIQIADILIQLYYAFDKVVYTYKYSMKAVTAKILNIFISKPLTEEEKQYIYKKTAMHMNIIFQ